MYRGHWLDEAAYGRAATGAGFPRSDLERNPQRTYLTHAALVPWQRSHHRTAGACASTSVRPVSPVQKVNIRDPASSPQLTQCAVQRIGLVRILEGLAS